MIFMPEKMRSAAMAVTESIAPQSAVVIRVNVLESYL
jgi:hypothetical protein